MGTSRRIRVVTNHNACIRATACAEWILNGHKSLYTRAIVKRSRRILVLDFKGEKKAGTGQEKRMTVPLNAVTQKQNNSISPPTRVAVDQQMVSSSCSKNCWGPESL